mmetsp:Transcript_6494/g.16160  ORF Transcript_6494/g.16160 Transcript_6494/m.16160 type:complete len:586 (+) Transcript_6494:650-2407(+)
MVRFLCATAADAASCSRRRVSARCRSVRAKPLSRSSFFLSSSSSLDDARRSCWKVTPRSSASSRALSAACAACTAATRVASAAALRAFFEASAAAAAAMSSAVSIRRCVACAPARLRIRLMLAIFSARSASLSRLARLMSPRRSSCSSAARRLAIISRSLSSARLISSNSPRPAVVDWSPVASLTAVLGTASRARSWRTSSALRCCSAALSSESRNAISVRSCARNSAAPRRSCCSRSCARSIPALSATTFSRFRRFSSSSATVSSPRRDSISRASTFMCSANLALASTRSTLARSAALKASSISCLVCSTFTRLASSSLAFMDVCHRVNSESSRSSVSNFSTILASSCCFFLYSASSRMMAATFSFTSLLGWSANLGAGLDGGSANVATRASSLSTSARTRSMFIGRSSDRSRNTSPGSAYCSVIRRRFSSRASAIATSSGVGPSRRRGTGLTRTGSGTRSGAGSGRGLDTLRLKGAKAVPLEVPLPAPDALASSSSARRAIYTLSSCLDMSASTSGSQTSTEATRLSTHGTSYTFSHSPFMYSTRLCSLKTYPRNTSIFWGSCASTSCLNCPKPSSSKRMSAR